MRAVVALFLLAGLTLGANPEVREITVQESIDLGLAYNLGLRSSRLGALLERFRVAEEDAAWDPVFTGGVGGGESLSPSRSSLAGADVVDTDSFNFTLGLTKPLRLGPSLGLTWRTDRTFSNSSFSTINPSYDTALELSLTVPLLQGRGRTAQESLLRASRAGARAARLQLLDDSAGLIEEIALAYWDLYASQDQVRVRRKSVEVAEEIEAAERRKLEPSIGRSTRLDVTKAHAETKKREAALIDGELQAANASDALRRLILPFAADGPDHLVLRAVSLPSEKCEIPSLSDAISKALSARHDLRKRDAEIEQLREGVVQARDRLRMQLDLTASVTWKGLAGRFSPAAGDSLEGKTPSAQGALNLTWPLGRRAARAVLHRTELELERARIDRRELVNQIVVAVRKAHREVTTTGRQIEATREEVRAATESLEGERQRLARGSTTVLEVARLESSLTEAELRLLQAETALAGARIKLYRVTGSLLERTGVSWGPDLQARRGKR